MNPTLVIVAAAVLALLLGLIDFLVQTAPQ
jgi:hypothetical protein